MVVATSRFQRIGAALALFAAWTFATWLLEGRIETLLRPEAALDRALYAVIANMLIGTIGAVSVLRALVGSGALSTIEAGFGPVSRSAISIFAGLALGLAFYALQGGPADSPVLLMNAFAQVLVVSVAEVLVCWAVVGASVEASLPRLPTGLRTGIAAVTASALFGFYHVGHSPPFNSAEMIALLTAVGLATSVFFFISRDVYGTIAFHNFLGTFGVVQALQDSGRLETFMEVQPPVLAMGAAALATLLVADRMGIRLRSNSLLKE